MAVKRTALGDLIDRVREANGWSDQNVADRAESRGCAISKQTISVLRQKVPPTLVPERMRALAEGLGVSVNEVLRAALADMGLMPYRPDDWSAEEAIRADAGLSEDTKRALLAIVSAVRGPVDELTPRRARSHARADLAARRGIPDLPGSSD
jgi:transcriptional regulator with XRE-family HTH domain